MSMNRRTASTRCAGSCTGASAAAPVSRHTASVSAPSVVTIGTPFASPAITDVRRVVTPSGYGCTSRSHARSAAATSTRDNRPLAHVRLCSTRCPIDRRSRNSTLRSPTNANLARGQLLGNPGDRRLDHRRHVIAVRAEVTNERCGRIRRGQRPKAANLFRIHNVGNRRRDWQRDRSRQPPVRLEPRMPRVGGHVHAAAGLDQLRRHHALHDREDVAPRTLQGKIKVRLVEHHADVDTALRHAVQPATETQVGALQSERVRHVLEEDDAGLLLPGAGERVPRARSESIGQTVNPAVRIGSFVRIRFPTRYPHVDRIARACELLREECRIVTDTPAVGWVLAGDEMPDLVGHFTSFWSCVVRGSLFGARFEVQGAHEPRTNQSSSPKS